MNPDLGGAFDDLLEPAADAGHAAPAPVASAATLPDEQVAGHSEPHQADHSPHGHEQMPSFDEFASGWALGLYQDPVLCAVLAGAALGTLGVFLVLRRAVFVTAAVSQSAGLGVLLAALWNLTLGAGAGVEVPPVVGALVLSLSTTALLTATRSSSRLPRETVLGFAYIAASALAVLVADRVEQEAHDVSDILFGTAVLVRASDLYAVVGVSAIVFLAVVVCFRGFVFVGFDAEGARIQRLPVVFLEILLWVLVALLVSVTTRAIGALPVFAFAVLPAMASLLLVRRLKHALFSAALMGAFAGGAGYLVAFFGEFPVGAAQAAVATAVFAFTAGATKVVRRS